MLEMPTVEQIRMLPASHRATISPQQIDALGHLNIRHYMSIFDDATWQVSVGLGMDQAYFEQRKLATMALQHVIHYLAEVREGETVAIHSRAVARSAKWLHMMYFMVNDSRDLLAATLEAGGVHVDLERRKSSAMPGDVGANLDALIAQHNETGWQPPLSGLISVR